MGDEVEDIWKKQYNTSHDKAIDSIQKSIKLSHEKVELMTQLLIGILTKKYFGTSGSKYALFRRKYFDKNYNNYSFRSEAYINSPFTIPKYKTKPSKDIIEGEIILIDLKTKKYAIDIIPEITFDKKVFTIAQTKKNDENN